MSDSNLAEGSRGDAVKWLQERLNSLGFKCGEADGIFGAKTEAALKEFQGKYGEEPDGIYGPRTAAALRPPIDTTLAPRLTADYRGMQAIARLAQFNHRGKYVLGAGGDNPRSPTPFTWKGAQYGSDCIGAVMWGLECPRHHPSFPEYEGDINCDSALMDAGVHWSGDGAGKRVFFEPVERKDVVPGTIVVFPSIRAKDLHVGGAKATEEFWKRNGFALNRRVRIGHVALVAGWEGLQDPFQLNEHLWDDKLASLVTIECRSSWPAIRLGRNVSFLGNTTYARYGETWTNEAWGVKFLRYVGP